VLEPNKTTARKWWASTFTPSTSYLQHPTRTLAKTLRLQACKNICKWNRVSGVGWGGGGVEDWNVIKEAITAKL
jgi:hypothetical protein